MQAERVKLGSARVERLLGRYRSRGRLRLCVEKKRLYTEVFRQTEGEPEILRRAKALAHYLDRRTIFIEEDELIVGNLASKPGGIEADAWGPSWPREELDELKERLLELSEEDEAVL
ncbi:MAG: pyruvate formate lyase family protein, partial [Armatimonadota bacterium]|nr:pyruvate formate lyase family protein [Armatimonadota bacterium]